MDIPLLGLISSLIGQSDLNIPVTFRWSKDLKRARATIGAIKRAGEKIVVFLREYGWFDLGRLEDAEVDDWGE